MLDIATQKNIRNQIFVINLKGSIDALSAAEFDDFFARLISQKNRFFILQASNLHSLSSAGISALVRFSRKLKKLKGAAAFVGLVDELRLLFNFFALNQDLPFFNDMEGALSWLNQKIREHPGSFEIKKEAILAHKLRRQAKTPIAERHSPQAIPEIPESHAKPLHSPLGHESPTEQESGIASPPTQTRPIQSVREIPDPGFLDESYTGKMRTQSDSDFFQPELSRESTAGLAGSGQLTRYLKSSLLRNCPQCQLKLRFYRTGNHLCPGCGFTIQISNVYSSNQAGETI